MKLKKRTILIGVSAGIAAYKILDLIKLLKAKGLNVLVVMTENAVKMTDRREFEKASGKQVYSKLFEENFDYRQVLENREVEHIRIAERADLIVVAPATANIIAKIANGLADDLLTTIIMASVSPVLLCPSMNVDMWHNMIFQENLSKLKTFGFYILPPDEGQLACGYQGVGRLKNPGQIAKEIINLLQKKSRFKDKKILVTAGGTSEPIDAVRTITNRASGKMGAAIAGVCHKQGADVLLLCPSIAINHIKVPSKRLTKDTSEVAKSDLDSSDGGGIRRNVRSLRIEVFETGQDLSNLIQKHISNYDIIFHTAAVSDYRPKEFLDRKLDSTRSLTLHLESTTKILSQLKRWNPKIKVIGFKAVYKLTEKELIAAGLKKLKESQSDYIIVNDVGREGIGFAASDNEVFIISPKGLIKKLSRAPKIDIARQILEHISI